jgi:2-polyprenyl-3-methyl-5-hydroxy-6-metoxy-1,4-benzoquinol methylase
MTAQAAYLGRELDVFAGAATWKGYWRSHVTAFIGGDVAEVGAGIGANTELLSNSDRVQHWTCLEPDPVLAQRLRESLRAGTGRCRIIVGTLEDVGDADRFDSVVSIDVLEHIEDDRAELIRAAAHLRPGRTLSCWRPAQWLFTAFDDHRPLPAIYQRLARGGAARFRYRS